MNKNSVLYNPTPVAPDVTTASTSFGPPIFPYISTTLPSNVIASSFINFFNSSLSAKNCALFAL